MPRSLALFALAGLLPLLTTCAGGQKSSAPQSYAAPADPAQAPVASAPAPTAEPMAMAEPEPMPALEEAAYADSGAEMEADDAAPPPPPVAMAPASVSTKGEFTAPMAASHVLS